MSLGALGLIVGLGSLTYPFGRDQGLYYYVAREWVLRGAVPYRDVLDHKTPGIYFLNALSVLLFGEQMWGIRLFDLACVVIVGVIAGSLSASPGERVRPGIRGAAVLATSVLYYGYFDYWNTAQSELWYGMFGIASVAAALRVKSDSRAALIAGLLAGAAVVTKPPVIGILLVAVAVLVRRRLTAQGRGSSLVARANNAASLVAQFGAAAAVVPVVTLSYFAAKGALPAMFDIVVGANSFYVKHERGSKMGDGILGFQWCYFPLAPALLLYLVYALVRARRAADGDASTRHLIAAAVTAGAYAAVIIQGKYYLLHWGVMVPANAVIAANFARTLAEAFERRGRGWAFPPTFTVLLGGLWALAMISWEGPNMWRLSTLHAWHWSWRQESREAFTDQFQTPGAGFWFTSSERVGNWLRDHTTPNDFVTVRAFQPEIYAVARRRHAGRFFWTPFLVNPARAYRRQEWLREDLDALAAHPPKYVVVLTFMHEGPDSLEYFQPLGYRAAVVMNEFTIMEQAAPAPER